MQCLASPLSSTSAAVCFSTRATRKTQQSSVRPVKFVTAELKGSASENSSKAPVLARRAVVSGISAVVALNFTSLMPSFAASTTKELVEGVYKKLFEGDLPGIMDTLTDDVVFVSYMPPLQPYSGTWKGKKAVQKYLETIFETEDVLRFDILNVIVDGDKAVVTVDGTSRVKKTGKSFDYRLAHVWTVKDGKISSYEEFTSNADEIEAALRG